MDVSHDSRFKARESCEKGSLLDLHPGIALHCMAESALEMLQSNKRAHRLLQKCKNYTEFIKL